MLTNAPLLAKVLHETFDARLSTIGIPGGRAGADADRAHDLTIDDYRKATGNDKQASTNRGIDAVGRAARLAGSTIALRRTFCASGRVALSCAMIVLVILPPSIRSNAIS